MSEFIKARGKMNNSFDPQSAEKLEPAARKMVEQRARLLGPSYRLFYSEPVDFVRGEGVRLWDSQGNEYLDAYNNVVSVGHGHPKVVEAVHEQMKMLCTHTRYLHPNILEYAEELRPTFGGAIGEAGHTIFTCTGSEANDLALRIAKHHTGKQGVIVTSEAYHGNSDATAAFSPSLGEYSPLGTWVRRVPAPDSYRIDPPNMGRWLADHVQAQIDDLERHGDGLAAFVVDSLFTSDGIYSHPVDVLKPVIEVVQKAGGLFVADEVQSGFARTGDKMWGYQRHGIDPDIVTMGKPMGNGYPVAGIGVRHDVVDEFGRDMRYFNTFGGNTVAMAAARAVLSVIKDEGLQENAARVGNVLLEGLKSIAKESAIVGDVRGAGLYIGVEIVKDKGSKEADKACAAAIVSEMRNRRVLISATGFNGNVLKIRPPLVFSSADAERFLEVIRSVLKTI
ncbi:4-aminobutyrate aminotransferase-like enzyme [Paraburkholderia fungorum]|jgi:4-aminobutyrate aminotransferase-like enzyme|uniref:aspartate aminotransferase family protein n=1 Tax=Paraburkholderia fungorum TaxID=134537 RepID=UPI000D4C70F4|nr:aspartate aminotransferase family protein [Paraburkholderia fungorum]PRZ55839.1 4-aminobutyrate aminotransferase-like enzyme [Paraburkholderia fungorum]